VLILVASASRFGYLPYDFYCDPTKLHLKNISIEYHL